MSSHSLVDELCWVLQCTKNKLLERLQHPEDFLKAQSYLCEAHLHTLYGRRLNLHMSHLTVKGADEVKAYEGFLGISVLQHMYARHRILLKHWKLPMVAVCVKTGHYAYFPLELVAMGQVYGLPTLGLPKKKQVPPPQKKVTLHCPSPYSPVSPPTPANPWSYSSTQSAY